MAEPDFYAQLKAEHREPVAHFAERLGSGLHARRLDRRTNAVLLAHGAPYVANAAVPPIIVVEAWPVQDMNPGDLFAAVASFVSAAGVSSPAPAIPGTLSARLGPDIAVAVRFPSQLDTMVRNVRTADEAIADYAARGIPVSILYDPRMLEQAA